MDGELAPQGQGRPIGARPRSSAGAREPEGPEPGAMVFPPFLPKQKGGTVKAKPVVAATERLDMHTQTQSRRDLRRQCFARTA
jgi:hypothetical protein